MASLSEENYNPEEYLLDTLNDLDIGYVKVRNDGIILNHNLTFNKIFAYNPEANLINTKILDYWLNSEEKNKFRDDLFKTGIVKKYIAPVKKVDGQKIFLELNFKLNKNSIGEIISSEGLFVDITEKIELEQKLKESETKFRLAVEKSPDFIVFIKKDGTITEANHLVKGFTKETVIGQSVFNEYFYETKDQVESVRKAISDTLESGEITQYNHSQIAPDGSQAFYESKVSPFEYDDESRIISLQLTIREITERRKAEQKLKESEKELENLNKELELKVEERTNNLKESEERWRVITKYTPDHIWVIDTNYKLTFVNYTVPELSVDEVIGNHYSNFVQKEYLEQHEEILKEIMETGKTIRWETGYLDNYGKQSYFDVHSGPIFKEGKVIGIVTRSTDITERKKKEDELRLQSEIMANLAEGVYLIRADDGKIVYTNPAFEEMFGYDHGEMIGKDVVIVNAPTEKTPEETKEEIVGILKETGEWHEEVLNVKKDGTPFWCYANVSLFDHPQYGSVIVSVHTDITERKKKEGEVRLQSAIITNLTEGVHLIRAGDGIIVYTNPAFEEMFGYDHGEMIGKDISLVNAPTDKTPEETKEEIMGILLETGEWNGEVNNIKKDGTTFWCYANVSLFDHPEYGSVIVAVHTDITERKKWEEKILEEGNKAQSYLDLVGVLIIALDKNGNISMINKKGCEVLGYLEEELIGKQWFKTFLPPRFCEPVFKDFKRLLRGELEPIEFYENPMLTKNGEEKIIAWHNSLLYDKDENIIGTLTSGEDITERKKSEENLKESERKLKEAQALGKIGYWEFDINSQQITWSDQVFEIYNRDPSLGPPSVEEEETYYTPEINERLKEYSRRAIEFGEEFNYDFQANLPSGMDDQ